MGIRVRDMEPSDYEAIYERIRLDFAPGEYPPRQILFQQLAGGVQKGYLLQKDGRDAAYCVCTAAEPGNCVLISLLAVFPGMRGEGVGTAFLAALRGLCAQAGGLLVEVEKPEEAETEREKAVRERRIRFYQKAGFVRLSGISYTIWDVPMHVMALPLLCSAASIARRAEPILRGIYSTLMGGRYMHKVQIRSLPED